jgi:putative phosphoesterase
MRIALISDIHANLQALSAVLEEMEHQKLDAVWNLGDLVGFGAYPNEVTKILRRGEVWSISGNIDKAVIGVKKIEKNPELEKPSPDMWKAVSWTYHQLTPKNRDYIKGLPKKMRIRANGMKIMGVHASPDSKEESLRPDTPESRFKELAALVKSDIVLIGHSHFPFANQVDGVWFVNPGSVGRPLDGDPRASYAVLELRKKSITVEHYRVEYDVAGAAAAIREFGLPDFYARMLELGKRPEEEAGE